MNATVKERPILFSSSMVRAILDGTKTQTRRVVSDSNTLGNYRASELLLDGAHIDPGPSPAGIAGPYLKAFVNAAAVEARRKWNAGDCDPAVMDRLYPRWFVGQRLWVRETWALLTGNGHRVVYRADADPPMTCGGTEPVRGMKWQPSIFMRRQNSRITLEISDVRVERLHDISEENARAEGVEFDRWDQCLVSRNYSEKNEPCVSGWFQMWDENMHGYVPIEHLARESFRTLWESINRKRAPWKGNTWAWVISFKRVEQAALRNVA